MIKQNFVINIYTLKLSNRDLGSYFGMEYYSIANSLLQKPIPGFILNTGSIDRYITAYT